MDLFYGGIISGVWGHMADISQIGSSAFRLRPGITRVLCEPTSWDQRERWVHRKQRGKRMQRQNRRSRVVTVWIMDFIEFFFPILKPKSSLVQSQMFWIRRENLRSHGHMYYSREDIHFITLKWKQGQDWAYLWVLNVGVNSCGLGEYSPNSRYDDVSVAEEIISEAIKLSLSLMPSKCSDLLINFYYNNWNM